MAAQPESTKTPQVLPTPTTSTPGPEAAAAATALPQLPEYAIKYAPYVYLHTEDEYMPGHPLEHLKHITPKTFKGDVVHLADDIKQTFKLLLHSAVNKDDVADVLVNVGKWHLIIFVHHSMADKHT